ncbi:MAG: efflux RND transporter permease subunit [Deltaproteobacteria bacterium]|nr:efflux RND transporter permease subunit [Deltaproteobacteria bacterium]
MRSLFRFFAERHTFANLFTVTILLLGISSLTMIKRDQYPDVDVGLMVITTTYPGASPEDVELNVTNKIEDELKEISDIKEVTSVSMENISSIRVEIDDDAEDSDKTKDEIRRAVTRVTDLPKEVTSTPEVLEIKTPFDPFIEVGVTGDIPYRKLREIARIFEKKLESVTGVARTERFGYRAREIQVEVDPSAMRRYEVPLREIVVAIQARNIRGTGGALESYTSEKNVVTLAQFRKPGEVGNVIIRSTLEGPLVRVKNLAVVRDDFEEEENISRMNGLRAISFAVYNKPSADVIRTVERVKRLIEAEEKNMPEGVRIIHANDRSKYVSNQFKIVLSNGAIGLALVTILLTLFLNIRTAFWVALGIPITFMGVVFLLPSFGAYLDTIVLTSMIIVIGIVVDDAIIVSESIYKRVEDGEEPLTAGVNGMYAVYRPVITTILTTFITFAPMFFMPGMMGRFVYVIPLTIGLALFISMTEVTVSLPAHIVRSLRRTGVRTETKRAGDWFDRIRDIFRKLICYPLKLRYPVIILFCGAFAGSFVYATNYMDFVLFPTKGAETFFATVELPLGASIEATSDKVKEIEDVVSALPENELDSYLSRTGMLFTTDGPPRIGSNYATIIVLLTPWSKRDRSADDIVEALRAGVNKITDINKVAFTVDSGGPPIGKAVNVRVIGSDDVMRKRLSDGVVKFLSTKDGVKDIERDDTLGKNQVEIKVNYDRLARMGLTVAEIARNVRIAYDGEVVTSVRYGEEDVDFRVILEEKARRKLSYLNKLAIPNNKGRLIALKEVASFEIGPGPNDIHHFDWERTTTVTADVLQTVTTPLDVTEMLREQFDVDNDYPGMRLGFGGEVQETEESMRGLYVAFVLAAVGVYFLLILLFNSITQPIMVLLAIPFGLMGVIFAFALHGEAFGFLALLGVVGMSGVVVNDSLVLVDYLNRLRVEKPEESMLDIVIRGTSDRLRAILMTTLTTVAGLLPLAYGIGGTDIYMGPMALALGYGLLFATPLTLILVPSLYLVGDDIRRLLRRGNN